MKLKNDGFSLMFSALIAACGSNSTAYNAPPSPPSLTADVAATPSITFTPNKVVILVGGTVTFDFGAVPHNVYFDAEVPGSPANVAGNNAGVKKPVTFNAIGTFVYNCHIHPGMQGTVVVQTPAH